MLYDQVDAEQFIANRSGETEEKVEIFLAAHFQYLTRRVTVIEQHNDSDDADPPEVFVEGIEVSTPALLEARDYITRITGMRPLKVARLLAEEIGYCASIGLVHNDAYLYARAWSDHSPWPELWTELESNWQPNRAVDNTPARQS